MSLEPFTLAGLDIKQPKPGSVADAQMSATADWSPMGEIYIRKSTIYEMSWPKTLIELGSSLVAISPYGGPIAIMRDESRVSVDAQQRLSRPNIFIYTSSGYMLAEIPWSSGRVCALGWTSTEKLMVVLEEGVVAKYDIHGNFVKQSSLPNEIKDTGIHSVKFYQLLSGSCGFGVLTRNWKFYAVSDLDGMMRVKRMAEVPDMYDPPSCWTIIPSSATSSMVYAAYGEKVYMIDNITCKEKEVPNKRESICPWARMTVAPSGSHISLIDEKGYLWLGTVDFKVTHVEYDTKCAEKVDHFEWCASHAVVITWGKVMFIKGKDKRTWLKYPLSSAYPCAMVADIDGIRIISKYFCEFLQKVPTASVSVLKIGSLEPGAMLNDALKEFEGEESHKADEYVRYIKDKMSDAISQCTEAAGAEFEPLLQKSLLRSVQFGKCFLGSDTPQNTIEMFVEMCQHLRVLNVIREHPIGMPLTYRQLLRLTIPVLIDRLIYRKLYPLAKSICESLRVPPSQGEEKILRQWALGKVKEKGLDGELLARDIVEKLQSSSCTVSFADIAKQAIDNNKPALAALLLDYEVSPTRQVPLLLDMKKHQSALDKAITSGDPELVNKVLWHIKKELPLREFLMIFHKRPVAAALYKKYCRENDHQTLLKLCEQESNYNETGHIQFNHSFGAGNVESQMELLRKAIKQYRDAQNQFALKCAEEQYKLLELQKDLEAKMHIRLVGLSLIETVYQCMLKGQPKTVEQFRKDFKIADTQFWWIRIKALAEVRDWPELEKFSKSKKSPIGYEPFVEVCIQKNSKAEALKYVLKLPVNRRLSMYMKIGDLEKAAEAAFQDRNIAGLDQVLAKCTHRRELAEKVNMLRSQLGVK